MSLLVRLQAEVPAETARVAEAVFPKGKPYLRLRDEIGPLYEDSEWGALFSDLGQPGIAPSQRVIATDLGATLLRTSLLCEVKRYHPPSNPPASIGAASGPRSRSTGRSVRWVGHG